MFVSILFMYNQTVFDVIMESEAFKVVTVKNRNLLANKRCELKDNF